MSLASLSSPAVVDDILNQLEAVARQLFPAWLPAADTILRRAISIDGWCAGSRTRWRPTADISVPLSPRSRMLRTAGLRRSGDSAPISTRGLARIIGESYGRDGAFLLIEDGGEHAEAEQLMVAVASQWLVAATTLLYSTDSQSCGSPTTRSRTTHNACSASLRDCYQASGTTKGTWRERRPQ
ncbi:MAG: hypothetical protein ACSLE6_04300 [Mycobacterium sp.]